MNCPKCGINFQIEANFCPGCGKKLTSQPRTAKTKQRGNGSGYVFKDKNGKFTVVATVYNPRRRTKRKGGFPTKIAAFDYGRILRAELQDNTPKIDPKTLKQIYDEWEPWYEPRIQSVSGYRSAFKHFSALYDRLIDTITAGDLQSCMDACKAGKRTHQMMKVLAGLLWGYAFDRKYVERKITENLYTGKGASVKRKPLELEEVEEIQKVIGKYRYADYIYCLCYLGYRPGEMLELRKEDLHESKGIWYLTEGKKTEAGRDRIVTIPDRILPIILARSYVPGTDLLFPMYVFSHGKSAAFQRFKQMNDEYFRESVFKPMMAKLGIAEGKVPYCARHTYSDLLKKADGDDRDKASLMGHSNYTFTRTNYQSTSLDDRNSITKDL